MLEDIQPIHCKEPCPFDNFDATRQVASCTPRIGPWQAWNGKEAIDPTTTIMEK